MTDRVRAPQLVALLAIGAVVAAAVAPVTRYDNAEFYLVVQTGTGVFAAMVAFLAMGRVRQTGADRGARVVVGLAILAIGNFVLAALLTALHGSATALSVWGPPFAHVLGAVFLVAAAFLPVRTQARQVWTVEAPAALLLLGAGSVLLAFFVADVAMTNEGVPRLIGVAPSIMRTDHAVAGVLFAIAAFGFLRARRLPGGGPNDLWLVAGCALAALARIGSVSAIGANERLWLTDMLRVVGYGCWMVGAARETALYWSASVRLALIEDRRRIAEELHDGVAQDLAFILMQSRLAVRLTDEPHLPTLVTAAERALRQTRQAIRALSSMRPTEPTDAGVR